MVIDMNKNRWIDISIATVEVMLMKTCYGRLNLVDAGVNCNHSDANKVKVKNMVEYTQKISIGTIALVLILLSALSGSGNINEKGNSNNISNINITLITGDTVAAYNISGNVTYSILPAKTGINRTYQIMVSPQGTYFIPNNVDLKKVDMELFNVDYLLKEGYTNLSFIPVMMTLESNPNTKNGIGAQAIAGIDKRIKIISTHKKIGVTVARLDKKDTGPAFDTLLANKDLRKVWLDKKRHISLSDSVPLLGAPAIWAQGYNGSGIKIAILDTGIDATHPDLNDIDDNSSTNDPKVQVKMNFVDWTYTDISDNTTADLYGHGTHVASIAAGTGEASGGLYKGVAPGAYLWNLRVLNKYGSGYDSWIIGGINYAAYGPDGIPHTGDEADIISMSLGGGPTDGDDPMSRAVNSAIDAGVVVTIAAGNCGNFCISTPGAADKVITVGATDKSDVLAYFSSTGPTLDYRVKPDVVAPGVDIVAARASGTSMGSPLNSYYTSASGTSMATPHVAGAAALILQKAKDSIPNWILEPPQHYNAFPTSYNWIDGIAGGTPGGIYGDDMATSAIDIGFNFTFYGINYSRLYFSTNGLITFDNSSTIWSNVPIPSPTQPNNFIAPFWDDLNVVNGTGNTYYKLDAFSNPKKFIITWKDIYKLGNYNPVTFQAVLFSNGSFLFQYKNISNIGVFDQTIGSENTDGSEGIQHKYASPVTNLSAVMFTPKISGLGKPYYVKNALISTAKDLSLSVYQQGGGRVQIPNATRARIIADPATVSFKIIPGINTTVITFYNLNTTSSRTLNLDEVVRDSSGNIVNAASLNTSFLIIAPNSTASVILTVDATSIPKSTYSGKLTAVADNGEKVGVIFGFANMNELSINKIKFDGTPAAYESVWVYKTNPISSDSFSRFVSTDINGMATVLVPDGEYNIWSGSFFNDIWIWTTKDELSVTSDTSTTLDERLSIPVSFNPNKPNQKFAGMYSVLDYYRYSWSLLYSNPSNTITRITPTSVNIAHSYEYYPAAYYNSSDPSRINTPEWHKLYFSEQGISSPRNYVADYSKLVRRTGIYKTALINESAGRHEWAVNNSYFACICWAMGWQMDLPQQRIEYITPDTYYWGGLSSQNWSLSDWEYRNYPPSSTPTDFWNTQPFSWSHFLYRGSNWLDLYGYAFMDTGKHTYSSSPVPSNFTLYRNSVKIYNLSTNGYFSYYNLSEPGTATYSAVIEGSSNQNLAVRSRTVLNFSYTGSGDYKPPKISWQIPKLDMYNRLPSNNVEINLSVVDENEYGFVNGTPDNLSGLSLEYSINEGATWNTVMLNSLGNGEYNATISGILINTFVSLRTKAIDTTGNSASHELIKAFLINVPTGSSIIRISNQVAMPGSNVIVPVWLDNGSNVAGGTFRVIFNSSIARATGVDAGDFGSPTYNIDNASGLVSVAVAQTSAIGKNKAILANITFNVSSNVPNGVSTPLILGGTDLNDETGSSVAHYTMNGQLKVEGVRGDVNRNLRRDTGDATLILRHIVGLPIPPQYLPILPIGDMNCNSRIDTGDATLILRDVVNLPIPICWNVLGNSISLAENEASTANMNIGESSIKIGQTVNLPVIITNSSEIAGGSVKILFNSSVARVESVTSGDFGTPIQNINNISGYVFIAVAGTTAIGKNEAILANITFRGEKEGNTPLNLTDVELNTEDGSLITPTVRNGSIITNIFPVISTITVVSPNGGENWTRGTTQMINWTSTVSNKSYVKIELLKHGVANKVIIASTLNDGSYPWLIPVTQVPGTDYKIKITNTTNVAYNDTSDNNFTIPAPSITVVSPNGGENWRRGTTQTIKWNSTESLGTYVKIELLKPGVANKVIILSTLNDGSHPWIIPATQLPGDDYKVKITSTINASVNDTSDNPFTIPAPSFTVVSPNGGENWTRGTTQTIKWNSTESPGTYVKIELLKPGTANKVIILSTLNDGSHPWPILATQLTGDNYRIKITSTINASVNDTSDNNFSIVPPKITVTSPNGGQTWIRGTNHLITWNYTGNAGTYVKIELLKDGVLNRIILSSTLNDKSQGWTIPSTQIPGTDYKIRITSTTNLAYNDTSDSNFTIAVPIT